MCTLPTMKLMYRIAECTRWPPDASHVVRTSRSYTRNTARSTGPLQAPSLAAWWGSTTLQGRKHAQACMLVFSRMQSIN